MFLVVSQRVSQEEVCVDVGADPGTAMQLVQKMQTTNVQLDQAASSPATHGREVTDTPAAAGDPPKSGPTKPADDDKDKPKKEKVRKEKPLASWHLDR